MAHGAQSVGKLLEVFLLLDHDIVISVKVAFQPLRLSHLDTVLYAVAAQNRRDVLASVWKSVRQ